MHSGGMGRASAPTPSLLRLLTCNTHFHVHHGSCTRRHATGARETALKTCTLLPRQIIWAGPKKTRTLSTLCHFSRPTRPFGYKPCRDYAPAPEHSFARQFIRTQVTMAAAADAACAPIATADEHVDAATASATALAAPDAVAEAAAGFTEGVAMEPTVPGVPYQFMQWTPIRFLATPTLGEHTLVFVGQADHIMAAAVPGTAVGDFLAGNPVVTLGLVDRLRPSQDAFVLSETLVARDPCAAAVNPYTIGLCRVILLALPDGAGRHNSPARPHAIREGLLAAKLRGPVEVILVLPDDTRAHAAALAVPRAIPVYSRKTAGIDGSTGSIAAGGTHLRVTVSFYTLNGSVVNDAALARMATLSSSIHMVGALMDQPASELHTQEFADLACAVAAGVGGQAAVIKGTALRYGGYGGLWGVGKAAVHPPALVVLSFVPEGVSPHAPSICMVGKGIVYDTGGLSIKTGTGMNGMKMDMGGAAGVLGAWRALAMGAASNGLARPLHALLCLAENSVGEEALRPDDVITLFSGLTVEINNTDAEGRLVLGDGVAHAVRFLRPAYIFDMATLTGAQAVATGAHHAALYCNDEELETAVVAAGKASGDLAHPLPYAPEFYRKEFASSIADMTNSVANRVNAQVSCAGQFVGNHLGSFQTTGKWCHIDMAAPAKAAGRGTGYGVALLEQLVTHLPAHTL